MTISATLGRRHRPGEGGGDALQRGEPRCEGAHRLGLLLQRAWARRRSVTSSAMPTMRRGVPSGSRRPRGPIEAIQRSSPVSTAADAELGALVVVAAHRALRVGVHARAVVGVDAGQPGGRSSARRPAGRGRRARSTRATSARCPRAIGRPTRRSARPAGRAQRGLAVAQRVLHPRAAR
jgi:hypothetical protein